VQTKKDATKNMKQLSASMTPSTSRVGLLLGKHYYSKSTTCLDAMQIFISGWV